VLPCYNEAFGVRRPHGPSCFTQLGCICDRRNGVQGSVCTAAIPSRQCPLWGQKQTLQDIRNGATQTAMPYCLKCSAAWAYPTRPSRVWYSAATRASISRTSSSRFALIAASKKTCARTSRCA